MDSLRELYRIGTGPSSSHTMRPRRAALIFLERFPDAASYRMTLYGSLASTGRGHLTDTVLNQVFEGHPLERRVPLQIFQPLKSGMAAKRLKGHEGKLEQQSRLKSLLHVGQTFQWSQSVQAGRAATTWWPWGSAGFRSGQGVAKKEKGVRAFSSHKPPFFASSSARI